jgi:riboflavin kinase/FMN adenylyltransferase
VAEALPAHGVYAGLAARAEGGSEVTLGPAAVNIGARPTFDAACPSIEAYIVGFDGDLYGQTLRLHLTTRLRPEQRFSSVEDLRRQIRRDIVRAAEVADLGIASVASAPCDC